METRRWVNPGQPQTLQSAVFLLYLRAALNVLFGAIAFPIVALLTIAGVAAGLGIANERRWGYGLGVGVALLSLTPFVLTLLTEGIGHIFDIGLLVNAIFPVLLAVLLLHPQSRDYQRIWFS